jgi:FlaA1/EpsC-like NDP-sugar epimerase
LVRGTVFLAGDLLIWTGSLLGAYLIRFDGTIPANYRNDILVLLAVFIPVKALWNAFYRLYQLTWRAVGLTEIMNAAKASTLSLVTLTTLVLMIRSVDAFADLPRSVLLIDYVLTTFGVAIFRASRRGWQLQTEALRLRRRGRGGTRLLIYGAGAAGARIAQSIREAREPAYRPVGFVDDDPARQGAYVQGLKVFGGREALPRLVPNLAVDEVLIAIPSAPPGVLQEIVAAVRHTGIQRVKVLPGTREWLAGRFTLKDIRDVNLQDLLGRPAVRIQYDALKTFFAGKRVLVTGAAGSIGQELVRQLARLPLTQIIATDISESGLFELEQDVLPALPEVRLRTSILDVRDAAKVEWLLAQTRPHLVFHAAAYKHVPMMEREVEEAVKSNIFGTLAVGEAAVRTGVETFVLISTDKAVNPASVMGQSKRLAEIVTQTLNGRGRTRFLVVRFGNVLGSRGSIIPVLQEQIRKGGPVTITHPDMARYFMSVAEAVLLVLQTPLMSRAGSIYMLDMGQPVRIVELAHALIRLSGLEPDKDVPIVFSGIRAGEKMEEDLTTAQERVAPTAFDRIMEVRTAGATDEVALRLALRELEAMAGVMDSQGIRAILARMTALPAAPSSATAPAGGLPRPL